MAISIKAALTELEEQFGNEELVAGAFMKTLLDHPTVAEGDVTQLRSFYERSGYRRRRQKRDQGINKSQGQLHRCSTLATGAITGNQSLPTANTGLVCSNKHKIEKYDKFIAMDVNQRAQLGKEKRLCISCFESADHQLRDCSL